MCQLEVNRLSLSQPGGPGGRNLESRLSEGGWLQVRVGEAFWPWAGGWGGFGQGRGS